MWLLRKVVLVFMWFCMSFFALLIFAVEAESKRSPELNLESGVTFLGLFDSETGIDELEEITNKARPIDLTDDIANSINESIKDNFEDKSEKDKK